MAAETIPEAEARVVCVINKAAETREWRQVDPNKPGSLVQELGIVCDPQRPGLVAEIRINRGHRAKRRTVNFGLWDTSSGGYVRIYQLRIADPNSPTHMEQGEQWFGSLEHMGDRATRRSDLDTMSFDAALELFLSVVNLQLDGTIEDPLDPEKYALRQERWTAH